MPVDRQQPITDALRQRVYESRNERFQRHEKEDTQRLMDDDTHIIYNMCPVCPARMTNQVRRTAYSLRSS